MRIINTTETSLYFSFDKRCRAVVESMGSKSFSFSVITNKHFRDLLNRDMLKVCLDQEEAQYLRQLLDSSDEAMPEPVVKEDEPVVKEDEPVVKEDEPVVVKEDEPVVVDPAPTGAPAVDESKKSSLEDIQGFMGGLTNPQPKPDTVEPDLGSLNTGSKEAEKPAAKKPAKKKAAKKKAAK